ncbi:MAG: ribbon-helix-helix protein CopG family [Rhizobium sp.]|nr:ribbon-helix-helix protein CopG family [Rhizobium sp.]
MATISIRVDDDIKKRLKRAAELTGMSQSVILREAIHDRMEELEDLLIVRERLAKPFRTLSDDDVWKDIGIDN